MSEGRGVGGWVKKMKGLTTTTTTETDNSMVSIREERGWQEVEEGKGGILVAEGDLTYSGEYTMQCEDDVL